MTVDVSSTEPLPSETVKFMLRLRVWAGYVLFAFITMHLANHALLLISLDAAQSARVVLVWPWQTLPGEILLYGSLLFHAVTALWRLFARHSLAMPPREMVQFIFGLLIPYLLLEHLLATGVARMAFNWQVDYGDVLRSMWVDRPPMGVQQSILLIIVWVHGCLGLARALPSREEGNRYTIALVVLAAVVPALALTGFAGSGRAIAIYGPRINPLSPNFQTEIRPFTQIKLLDMIGTAGRSGYALLIGAILIARQLRAVLRHASGIDIAYEGAATVHVAQGTSVLEASRINGIPHYSVCGGNGRCSTCRVRVLWSEAQLPAPGAQEAVTLKRIGAGPEVRLACQLRPAGDLKIERILAPPANAGRPASWNAPPQERALAVLFCDLRDFTAFSEQHLPYDVVFLLNRYFEIVGSAVEAAGGQIDQFIGDGAMAVFGLETDFETACHGALQAAAAIRTAVAGLGAELRQEPGLRLSAVAGLHAGNAIVGEIGVRGASVMTVVGDTVNVASRLEALAKVENAAIVASAEVVAASGIDVSDVPNREVMLRGRQTGQKVYLFGDEDIGRCLL